MNWRSVPLLGGLMLSGYALAQPFGGLVNITAETDADHFTALRAEAAGLFGYMSPWQFFGVAARTTGYSQQGWHQNASGVSVLWRDQVRDTLAGVNAEAGIVEFGGRTRPVGDVSWSLRPAPATGVELLAAAGLVETKAAIEQGIGYSFWAGSVEQTLAERLTATALVGWQPFTDGNDRVHFRARLIWDALPEQGINLQARWRQYRSSKTDVGGAYFDPESYQQWLALAGFRKRLSGWTASGALGAGQEFIRNSGTTTQPTYLAELRLEGPVAGDARLAVQALYNRSAGFSNSSDYWWSLLSVTLIAPF
ncbi:MAG: hypothetical protein ABI624_16620 [Casimicrobiaceae bacterium]